jgi:hypothetical protein
VASEDEINKEDKQIQDDIVFKKQEKIEIDVRINENVVASKEESEGKDDAAQEKEDELAGDEQENDNIQSGIDENKFESKQVNSAAEHEKRENTITKDEQIYNDYVYEKEEEEQLKEGNQNDAGIEAEIIEKINEEEPNVQEEKIQKEAQAEENNVLPDAKSHEIEVSNADT